MNSSLHYDISELLSTARQKAAHVPARVGLSGAKPDVDAIRALSAHDVAERLGLVDAVDKRWRWRGYEGSAWLEFHRDGAWYDHKHHQGGDCISLVQSYLAGAPDYAVRDEAFWPACEMIAQAYGLWASLQPLRERAEQLAKGCSLEHAVELLESGSAPDAWSEVETLAKALGLDADQITLCPDLAGTGAMCWQPAVPWQGARISRKDSGGFGGWTKARALEHARGQLHIVALDFDGIEGLKPRADLIESLVLRLERLRLAPAALVWSSVEPEGMRAKAHLYWRCARPARDEAQWLTWWDALAEVVRDEAAKLRVADTRELDALVVDVCTRQVSRLFRLPGFAKAGKDAAGVVGKASGAMVDVADYLERRPVWWGAGAQSYAMGPGECIVEIEQEGEEKPPKVIRFARDLWPLQMWQRRDGSWGVRYRYHTREGAVRYGLLPAQAWVHRNNAKAAASAMASRGVQIGVGADAWAPLALGYWAQTKAALELPMVEVVDAPGWHDDCKVYLAGERVLGGGSYVPTDDAIALRGARRGTLSGWQTRASRLIHTPGLLTSLAVSLAGPLVELLGRPSFGLHMHARTTAGKSTALKLAAQVWTQDYERFNATPKSLERRALLYNSACYCLDELGQAGLSGGELGQLVYNLLSGQERGRLTKDAELRGQGRWALTMLTTGEVSVAQLLGDAALGGHMVRWIDLPLEVGELTEDELHADECEELSRLCWGVVGEAWIEAIMALDADDLAGRYAHMRRQWREIAGPSDELGRIVDSLAVAGLALWMAHEAGLLPWLNESTWSAWVSWMLGRVGESRAEAEGPEARAWSRIKRDIELNGSMYPYEGSDVDKLRDLRGVLSRTANDLYVSLTLLAPAATDAGTTPEALVGWLKAQGLTTGESEREYKLGRRLRWIKIRLQDETSSVPPNGTGGVLGAQLHGWPL